MTAFCPEVATRKFEFITMPLSTIWELNVIFGVQQAPILCFLRRSPRAKNMMRSVRVSVLKWLQILNTNLYNKKHDIILFATGNFDVNFGLSDGDHKILCWMWRLHWYSKAITTLHGSGHAWIQLQDQFQTNMNSYRNIIS